MDNLFKIESAPAPACARAKNKVTKRKGEDLKRKSEKKAESFCKKSCGDKKDGGYIAVTDSGLGGLSVLAPLCRALPEEKFLYFGDNGNAPYGNRTESDLLSLTMRNLDYILSFGIKAIVVACNTLSATLLKDIESYSGVKCFGVYPPVFRPLADGDKTLLLATPFTCARYRGVKGLYIAETRDLAEVVEKNAFNLPNVDVESELKSSRFYYCTGETDSFGAPITKDLPQTSIFSSEDRRERFDAVILGCTHYLFVKNKIVDHLRPKKVISGNEFTVHAVKKYFQNGKSQVNKRENAPLFIGEYADFNANFYKKVVSAVWNSL